MPTNTKSEAVTLIQSCTEGSYMNSGSCEPCTKCGYYEFSVSKCNSTHDTICKCIPGSYRDIMDGQCKQCTKCAVGWGASPACTSTSNTVCVVCPKNSYSSIESSFRSCQSCTVCDQRDEVVLKGCTSKQDTTCFSELSSPITKCVMYKGIPTLCI